MDWLNTNAGLLWERSLGILSSPQSYLQLGVALIALLIAWTLAASLTSHAGIFRKEPRPGPLHGILKFIHDAKPLVLPLIAVVALGIAVPFAKATFGQAWLVKATQGIGMVILLYSVANHFIKNETVIAIIKWVGVPVAILYAVGLLGGVIVQLDSAAFEVGNIRFTAYGILRTLLFGVILFWLGRASNDTGKRVIRNQKALDTGTQEVLAKLFEIAIFVAVFLILINVMGIDLTALAVFGGALGVGLGFGLQQIASNFISGLIILLDRSVTVGDYIELEDGKSGTLRELTMRSATLETFEGKDIMVPNEKFITTSFINWTHNNKKQRYDITFQVAYSTDLEKLFPIVRDIVTSHPKVLSGDALPVAERPDAEIKSFDDSGITILVEFWMEGIDDGENRVGADLNMMIWTALKANGIQIPFPQREVRILGDVKTS